ncbi:MAG: CoA-binding protein [Chloroflexi bacterium]|nr:CoA-binding protein [Chloroflexota bacterium]
MPFMPIEDDASLRQILRSARVIAVVGHSDKPHRTSYQIGRALKSQGYTVYPVNPTVEEIDGDRSYSRLADVPEPIDIVDVFRRSEHLQTVVDEAIAVGAKVVWAQLGVIDHQAAETAEAAGLQMVMDRCIEIEYGRLIERS